MFKKSVTLTVLAGFSLLAACGTENPAGQQGKAAVMQPAESQSAPPDARKADADTAASPLQSAIDGEHRSPENSARDRYRHPLETLKFFEVEPGMTVVEVWPGGGWYTEILAPYLRESGKLYAAGFAVSKEGASPYLKKVHGQFMAKTESKPAVYDRVEVTELGLDDAWSPAPEGSADRVLTFRNVHNWIKGGFAEEMFDSFYRTLKPGGILGVVDHRAAPDTDSETMETSGYVTEALVKELAEKAGFEHIASSEINANPVDDRDHPEGVWSLPPSLRGGEKDAAKYREIGESDRLTMKFRRPVE